MPCLSPLGKLAPGNAEIDKVFKDRIEQNGAGSRSIDHFNSLALLSLS